MTDVLDILDIDRDAGPSQKSNKKKRQPEQTFKKPEGMNREVYALLYADNKDSAPLIPTDFGISKLGFPEYGYKKAKANLSLRKVRKWVWTPFNPSRNDLVLKHWRREVDITRDYPFAKMNIKINVPEYSDSAYQQLLQSDSWTKIETDYLMHMCKKYDARFVVIHDKWDEINYKKRTIEDIKDRYYHVCNQMNKQKVDSLKGEVLSQTSATNTKICVFDAEHERKRKEQLIKLYNRTAKEVEEEQMLISELRKIEQRKKEREKKTQDLQKLITAADTTTELRRNEQQAQSRASTSQSRSNRKKSSSQVKSSRTSDIGTASHMPTLNLETASIKFPEPKSNGIYLRSSRMKLPSSVGQKRSKAILTMLTELRIEQHPMATEEICHHFNELRSDMVLLYELKTAVHSLDFDLQSLSVQSSKHHNDLASFEASSSNVPQGGHSTPRTPNTPIVPMVSIKEEPSDSIKKISEIIDVSSTPRKRKAALESEIFMRKISRKT